MISDDDIKRAALLAGRHAEERTALSGRQLRERQELDERHVKEATAAGFGPRLDEQPPIVPPVRNGQRKAKRA